MGQPVFHWELWSKDPEKISEFYRKAFDWDIQHIPAIMGVRLNRPSCG